MAEAITEMIIPGTYIEVRSEGLIGVGGIATGNVGIVGTASKGPIGTDEETRVEDRVQILSSFADAREVFGDYDPWTGGGGDELTLVRALQQVFANGGSTVYAVRCAGEGALRASATLGPTNTPVVTLEAKSEGTWGNDITVEVAPGSSTAFIEANTQTVTANPLVPLHKGIVPSPRNTVRITKPNGQTRKLNLRTSGQAQAANALVNADGELSFVNADRPDAGDEVVASYEVGSANARDLIIRRGAAKETYTVVDADDIAATIGEGSTMVQVVVPNGAGARVPDPGPALQLLGGNDGAAATAQNYSDGLALLEQEAVNIVVLAGQGFTAGQAALLAHLETTENAGRERIAVVGADRDLSSSVAANADAVSSGRLVLTAPGVLASEPGAAQPAKLPAAYAAAAVAGLIASLAVQVSPTNKTLAVSGLTTYYDDGDLKKLLTARVMPLERKAGYRIVKGISTDTSAFKQVSVRRIVDYAKAGTRIGSLPYIGRLNNARVRAALQATLNGFLSDMVLNEALTEFTLTVTATRDQEINGVCLVTMMLKPTFSIDYIKVIMNLS